MVHGLVRRQRLAVSVLKPNNGSYGRFHSESRKICEVKQKTAAVGTTIGEPRSKQRLSLELSLLLAKEVYS